MKIKFLYTIIGLSLAAIVFLGNKNGRATQVGEGNTGAPGDALVNGQPKTCQACHSGGAFNATVNVQLLNASNNAVTEYVPGQQYTAKVTINTATNPQGYGFQMVSLRDNNNTNAGTFLDVGVNNYKLKTLSSGRVYAEQDNVSTPNQFDVLWTAPAAGTGGVTLYAAGNAVNKNGNSGGDAAASAQLKVAEKISSATGQATLPSNKIKVFPNPIEQVANLNIQVSDAGEYDLRVRDLSGRLVAQSKQILLAGENNLSVPAAEWSKGALIIELIGKTAVANVKVVKL